jgi:transcriptional regulator with XRE-family HTH domain
MEVRQVLGERIRRQRMALGLNQTELAEQTAIPIQVLSRLEHGHQSIYVERLVELAQALRVSTDYLLGLTIDSLPPSTAQRNGHQQLESKQKTEVTPRPPKRQRPRKAASVA